MMNLKKIVAVALSTLLIVGISSHVISAADIDSEESIQVTIEMNGDEEPGAQTTSAQDTNASQNDVDNVNNDTYEVDTNQASNTEPEYTYSGKHRLAKASSTKRNSKSRRTASRKRTTKRVKKKSKTKTSSSRTKRRRTTTRRTSSSSSANNSSSVASNATVINVEQYENEVISLVNQERKKAGVAELTIDSDLMEATDIRAKELVSKYSHTRPDGTSCFTVFKEVGIDSYRAVGENIARGQKTPAAVMESWMNSSGHRRNILSANYERIGVGCYQGADGKLNWVQLFYTPHDNDD